MDFISAHWCENPECEAKIKADTKATTRCLPDGQIDEEGNVFIAVNPQNTAGYLHKATKTVY